MRRVLRAAGTGFTAAILVAATTLAVVAGAVAILHESDAPSLGTVVAAVPYIGRFLLPLAIAGGVAGAVAAVTIPSPRRAPAVPDLAAALAVVALWLALRLPPIPYYYDAFFSGYLYSPFGLFWALYLAAFAAVGCRYARRSLPPIPSPPIPTP